MAQLRTGRSSTGLALLVVWLTSSAVLLRAPGEVYRFLGGSGDERVAAVSALLGFLVPLLLAVAATLRGERGPAREPGAAWRSRLPVRAGTPARIGAWIIGGLVLIALLAPLLAPHPPDLVPERLGEAVFNAPSLEHPLGTDGAGRDVLSRLLYGTRVSLTVGLGAVAISVLLGALLGGVSGYLGGWTDAVVMRGVDVVLAFPRLVLLMAVVALFDPSLGLVILVLGLTQWPPIARLVRGEVLSIREREWVSAARVLGFSSTRILLRHVLPGAAAPLIVAATLGIGNAIVLEAGLSFLGLGFSSADTPTWGAMVADGRLVLVRAWWLSLFPGLAIAVTVLAFNLVGDGLRDILDPRSPRPRVSRPPAP